MVVSRHHERRSRHHHVGAQVTTIPDAWVMGYVQGERIRGNRASYPELVRQAVAHWLDQERMEREAGR